MSNLTELLPAGTKFRTQGRTISFGETALLSSLTWSIAEMHTNRSYAQAGQFGDVILPGPCTLAIVIGLTTHGPLPVHLESVGIRWKAILGIEEVRFPVPVKPDDTLLAETELLDARVSRKDPTTAILRVRDTAINQRGEVVLTAIRVLSLVVPA